MELVNNDSLLLFVVTSHRNITSISNTLVIYDESTYFIYVNVLKSHTRIESTSKVVSSCKHRSVETQQGPGGLSYIINKGSFRHSVPWDRMEGKSYARYVRQGWYVVGDSWPWAEARNTDLVKTRMLIYQRSSRNKGNNKQASFSPSISHDVQDL